MHLKSVLFLVFLINTTFSPFLLAENVATKTKELTGLQKKIKKISQNINELEIKKSKLLVELKKLDTQYGRSASILFELKRQIEQLNNELKKNQQLITTQRQGVQSQKKALGSLVKAAYGMGKNEKIKLMLNQQEPLLSSRMMVYYDYFNQVKLDKIAEIELALEKLRELEAKQMIEASLLEEKQQKRKQQHSLFIKTKRERQLLLAKINKEFDSKKKKLKQFKVSEQRLKSLILSLQNVMDDFPLEEGSVKEFAKLKGKLPWPVKGRVIKKFGQKRSDSRWDGVLIKAKEGVDIRAITRGRVVYADWLRGYGLLTIIEHGDGFMTLYAFNQNLYKSVGDWVESGTVIATVGQSGGQAGTGLYFGIRKKGKPVNPVKWCRKVRRGKVG